MLPKDVLFRLCDVGGENEINPLKHGYYVPLKVRSRSQINKIHAIFNSTKIISEHGHSLSNHKRVEGAKMKKMDNVLKNMRFTVYSSVVEVDRIPISMTPSFKGTYSKLITDIKSAIVEMSIWTPKESKLVNGGGKTDDGRPGTVKLEICKTINRVLCGGYKKFRQDDYFYTGDSLISSTLKIVDYIVRLIRLHMLDNEIVTNPRKIAKRVLDKVLHKDKIFYDIGINKHRFRKTGCGRVLITKIKTV